MESNFRVYLGNILYCHIPSSIDVISPANLQRIDSLGSDDFVQLMGFVLEVEENSVVNL